MAVALKELAWTGKGHEQQMTLKLPSCTCVLCLNYGKADSHINNPHTLLLLLMTAARAAGWRVGVVALAAVVAWLLASVHGSKLADLEVVQQALAPLQGSCVNGFLEDLTATSMYGHDPTQPLPTPLLTSLDTCTHTQLLR